MLFILLMTKSDLSFLASCSFYPFHPRSPPLPLYDAQTGIERFWGRKGNGLRQWKRSLGFNDMLCCCLTLGNSSIMSWSRLQILTAQKTQSSSRKTLRACARVHMQLSRRAGLYVLVLTFVLSLCSVRPFRRSQKLVYLVLFFSGHINKWMRLVHSSLLTCI